MDEREAKRFEGLVDDDLRAIITTALDIAYYRRSPIGDDLARAAAHELTVRVSELPETKAL